MFISDPDDLRKASGWSGTGKESRKSLMDRLHHFFPPSIMLPPRRLLIININIVIINIISFIFHSEPY